MSTHFFIFLLFFYSLSSLWIYFSFIVIFCRLFCHFILHASIQNVRNNLISCKKKRILLAGFSACGGSLHATSTLPPQCDPARSGFFMSWEIPTEFPSTQKNRHQVSDFKSNTWSPSYYSLLMIFLLYSRNSSDSAKSSARGFFSLITISSLMVPGVPFKI